SETLRSLELVEGENSLLKHVDETSTPMGRRLLKRWVLSPLGEKTAVEARLGAVENFVQDVGLADTLRRQLGSLRDLERLTAKTAMGLALPRDLVSIREVLKQVPAIK